MIRPVNKRLIAKLYETPKPKSSLFVVNEPQNPNDIFEVIDVCQGETRFVPGDKVLVSKYGQLKIEMDGESLYIIESDSILGVVYDKKD